MPAIDGFANTGGGGGGAGSGLGAVSGSGGSGIVVIAYLTPTVNDKWPVAFNSDYSVLTLGTSSSSVIPVNGSTTTGPNLSVGAQVYLDSFVYDNGVTVVGPPFPVAMAGFYIIQSITTGSGFYVSMTVKTSIPQQKAMVA